MKKLISALLVLALLVSSASIVFAEESAQLTSERVMERLAAGDDAAADVFGQISNAALRLAEMTAAVASVKVDNQDDVDHLNRILDAVSEADAQNPDTDEKLSIGVIKTLEGLSFSSSRWMRKVNILTMSGRLSKTSRPSIRAQRV